MAVHIPQSFSARLQLETRWNVLDYELREQKAHTLRSVSGQVKQAPAALWALDTQGGGSKNCGPGTPLSLGYSLPPRGCHIDLRRRRKAQSC
jgi:hypothetical protein